LECQNLSPAAIVLFIPIELRTFHCIPLMIEAGCNTPYAIDIDIERFVFHRDLTYRIQSWVQSCVKHDVVYVMNVLLWKSLKNNSLASLSLTVSSPAIRVVQKAFQSISLLSNKVPPYKPMHICIQIWQRFQIDVHIVHKFLLS
jgi:hypothetical protein